MIPVKKSISSFDDVSTLTACRNLVDGLNPAFLISRLILPVGLDGDRLVCAVGDASDSDAQAALAFASGRPVVAVDAPRGSILAAIRLSDRANPDHARALPRVPHAAAVVLLRRHIMNASAQGADTLRIETDRNGGMASLERGDQILTSIGTTTREMRKLIDAADALCEADGGADGLSRFAYTIDGERRFAVVATIENGRIIRRACDTDHRGPGSQQGGR